MADGIKVLEEAISDVGYWTWWTAELPDIFQVEFGGTQLWNNPLDAGKPPSGQIALMLTNPTFIAFITSANISDDLPSDWPTQLHQDKLQLFNITHDNFTVSSLETLNNVVSKIADKEIIIGQDSVLETVQSDDVFLAFWAGEIGLVAVAETLKIHTHEGGLTLDDVVEKHKQWWEYWRVYWARRETSDAMPKDYACEVTIPMDIA